MEKEKRIFEITKLEVRAAGDNMPSRIEGYAAVFNARSHNLGGFVEEIAPGAFSNTLARQPDVRATIDHKGGLTTIGRTKNGTLRLQQDDRGLRVTITPPDTQAGQDALQLVRGGYVDQMSFMFSVPTGGDEWLRLDESTVLRRLNEVDLDDGDVALVTYPAYPQTSAEARGRADMLVNADGAGDDQQPTGDDIDGSEAQAGELLPDDDGGAQERLALMDWRLRLAETE